MQLVVQWVEAQNPEMGNHHCGWEACVFIYCAYQVFDEMPHLTSQQFLASNKILKFLHSLP